MTLTPEQQRRLMTFVFVLATAFALLPELFAYVIRSVLAVIAEGE